MIPSLSFKHTKLFLFLSSPKGFMSYDTPQVGPVHEPYEINRSEYVLAILFGPCLYQYFRHVWVLDMLLSRWPICLKIEVRSIKRRR